MTSLPDTQSPLPQDRSPEPDALDAEAELVRAAQRDPQAFGALYRRHAAAIARYLRRRLGDAHVVEDALSDTFEEALEQLGRYRSRGIPLRAWLYRLANGCAHRARRREALRAMERLEADPADPASGGLGEPGPGSEQDERARRARMALLRIAPRYQAALTLFYLEGLSIDEVAEVCDCAPGTIKSRLARGRAALRRRLERKDEDA